MCSVSRLIGGVCIARCPASLAPTSQGSVECFVAIIDFRSPLGDVVGYRLCVTCASGVVKAQRFLAQQCQQQHVVCQPAPRFPTATDPLPMEVGLMHSCWSVTFAHSRAQSVCIISAEPRNALLSTCCTHGVGGRGGGGAKLGTFLSSQWPHEYISTGIRGMRGL